MKENIILNILIILALLSLPNTSYSFWFKKNNEMKVCHPENKRLCVSVLFGENLNSYEEQIFIVNVSVKDPVEDFQLRLWMHMDCGESSHPGAPVKINKIDSNTYQISEAYFFMIGEWEIIINFKADKEYEIIIPLQIEY